MEEGAKLSVIAEKLDLKNFTPKIKLESKLVKTSEINRPALQLNGFFEHFEEERIQLIGMVEWSYLQSEQSRTERMHSFEKLMEYDLPCIIFCRGFVPEEKLLKIARAKNVPLLGTERGTSEFMAELIHTLSYELAPMTSIHGVLVDVYGEGVLITGESGIGKSEAALELIKRGHRLVTDDVVEIRKVSDASLVGTAPDITKHFIELRGIGIIDVKALFGASCVRDTQNIDLVIQLEQWVQGKFYDRLGIGGETVEIVWKATPKLHKTRPCLFLYNDGASSNLLPLRLMTDEQVQAIETWFQHTRAMAKDYRKKQEKLRSGEDVKFRIPKPVIALGLIALLAGAALSGVYAMTKPGIAAQEEKKKLLAYETVLPGAADLSLASEPVEALEGQVYGEDFGTVYINEAVVGTDAAGNVIGWAVSVTSADGYKGDITLSLGVTADGTVNGISFTEISETPGLGLRWKEEEAYYGQFAGRNAAQFLLIKGGGAAAENEIDGISGATFSSKAVVNAVNAGLDFINNTLRGE